MSIVVNQYNVVGHSGIPMAVDLVHLENKPNQPVIIYAHGINGFKDWGGMDLIANYFAEAGFAFLKFNFSHNGTTPAYPTEFHDLESYSKDTYLKRQFDLKQILRFVCEEHPEVDLDLERIYLIGHSRGGADAILFASQEPRIKKLISWASVAHARTPWSNLSDDAIAEWREKGFFERENGRTHQKLPIAFELYEEYKEHKAFLDLEARAREVAIPWLIVHGDDDEAVFVKDAYTLKAAQPEAQVKIIPTTGHTFDRIHPWEKERLPAASELLCKYSLEFLRQ